MTQEQFVYWLQGKLEGRVLDGELKEIQDHLKTVFHKVTPIQPIQMPNREGSGINTFGLPPTIIC